MKNKARWRGLAGESGRHRSPSSVSGQTVGTTVRRGYILMMFERAFLLALLFFHPAGCDRLLVFGLLFLRQHAVDELQDLVAT